MSIASRFPRNASSGVHRNSEQSASGGIRKNSERRSLSLRQIAIAAAIAMVPVVSSGAEPWKPAAGPLMTRWASEVTPENVHQEYPRPQLVRPRWQNLNGLWQFAHAQADEAPPFGKQLAKTILVPFPVESALSGVMEPAERMWYRRTFEVPADWKGSRLILHFGAVDWDAVVYINRHEVGRHQGGYDGFRFDITDAISAGGEQELVVGVFDPTDAGMQPIGKQLEKPNGIWYTPSSGIWQTVWLEPVPAASIASLEMVPDVDGGALVLTVRGQGTTDKHAVQAATIVDGATVSHVEGPLDQPLRLPVPKAHLWSPDDPYLYDLSVTLREAGKTVDEAASYFGMRKIGLTNVDGVTRIALNGQPLFQIGPLDQGFWPDGLYAAPTDEALRYDLEVTKRLGFNMTRKHVKVEPERWYYWCDKLGLLVWQDMPHNQRAPEGATQFESELNRLITGRFNHPSIVMWVVFNEGWGQYDTPRLTEEVKRRDPSRLVSNASGWHDKQAGDIIDMHKYPGPGSPAPESTRAAVLGEFGGLGLAVKGHTWLPERNWSYRGTESPEQLTIGYLGLLRDVWKLQRNPGLSAAVYTQLTDVEIEINGLLTYDRAVIKVDESRVAAANRGELPDEHVIVATSEKEPQGWRYTLTNPGTGWYQPNFDDSGWTAGQGGFGTAMTPGSVIGTEWKSGDIWLRRECTVDEDVKAPIFNVHHDEDVEIYLNGRPAATAKGYTTAYQWLPMSAEAAKGIKRGKNVLAVHCRQTGGGQYIDVGVIELR